MFLIINCNIQFLSNYVVSISVYVILSARLEMCESALNNQRNKSQNQNDTVLQKPASYIEVIEDEKEAIKCWKASRYFDHIVDTYLLYPSGIIFCIRNMTILSFSLLPFLSPWQ